MAKPSAKHWLPADQLSVDNKKKDTLLDIGTDSTSRIRKPCIIACGYQQVCIDKSASTKTNKSFLAWPVLIPLKTNNDSCAKEQWQKWHRFVWSFLGDPNKICCYSVELLLPVVFLKCQCKSPPQKLRIFSESSFLKGKFLLQLL